MARNISKDSYKPEEQSTSLSVPSKPGKNSFHPPTGKPAMD